MKNPSKALPLLDYLIALVLGLVSFWLIIDFKIVNPTFVAWLGPDADPLQHQIGWMFFRQAPWSWPLGLNPLFGLELSNSIVYSDSIPLLAILFKPWQSFLPSPFQYFGLWTLLCFVLSAFFGYRLMGLLTNSILYKILGVPFFIFCPLMLNRITMHQALTGQFLILAGLYLTLKQNQSHRTRNWAILLVVCALTHFYFLAIVMGLYLSNVLLQLTLKHISKSSLAKEFFQVMLCVIFSLWLAGYFVIDELSMASAGWGYGVWALNLFSYFQAQGWSYLLPPLAAVSAHQDRFAFPGLGVFVLLLFACAKPSGLATVLGQAMKRQPWLMLLLFSYTLFAITNQVSIGALKVNYPLPDTLLSFASSFRASDRFFWPVVYCLALLAMAVVMRSYAKRWVLCILSLACLVQIIDTKAGWGELHTLLNSPGEPNPVRVFKSPFWQDLAQHYKAIELAPAIPLPPFANAVFLFAAEHYLGVTPPYLARLNESKLFAQQKRIEDGTLNRTRLYVAEQKAIPFLLSSLNFDHDLLTQLDDFYILAPNWKACSACPVIPENFNLKAFFSPLALHQTVGFTSADPKSRQYLLFGWSTTMESFGVWSMDSRSGLTLPLPKEGSPKTLALELKAFVTAKNPELQFSVVMNGEPYKTFSLSSADNQLLTLPISPLAAKQGYVALHLIFTNPRSPQELGLSEDKRILGIGLKSVQFN
jgi:hypothetical protein